MWIYLYTYFRLFSLELSGNTLFLAVLILLEHVCNVYQNKLNIYLEKVKM
jgi:hypothetical protein